MTKREISIFGENGFAEFTKGGKLSHVNYAAEFEGGPETKSRPIGLVTDNREIPIFAENGFSEFATRILRCPLRFH